MAGYQNSNLRHPDAGAIGLDAALADPHRRKLFVELAARPADGSPLGPPAGGLLPLATMPADWGAKRPERILAEPFPLTKAWVWEADPRRQEEIRALTRPVFDFGSVVRERHRRGSRHPAGAPGPGLELSMIFSDELSASRSLIASAGLVPLVRLEGGAPVVGVSGADRGPCSGAPPRSERGT